ncbi:MAG: hypothetical protein RR061_07705 [Muribaculaceae bacterium]
MKTITRKIETGDQILAMLTVRGTVIAQLSRNNFASVSEIIMELREIAQKYSGLTQLFIRNFTEGWCVNSPLFLTANAKPKDKIPPHEGRQYVIAWN